MSIDIEQTLKNRFSAPLAENYKRRIIFWQDPDEEFSSLVDELRIDNVKLLKLTGKNNFYAKQLLSEADTESNYLVYNPLSYTDVKDNWLLDIELYSEEFRADLLSIRMQELDMPATAQMRKAMKSYSRFFDNKERVAKLSALNSNYSAVGQLHVDVLSVLSGAKSNTAAGVIRAVLMSGLEIENNDSIVNIRKFGNEAVLWELINKYTGYIYDQNNSLIGLASHILLTTLSLTLNKSKLSGLEKYISEKHQQTCYSIINEWAHSEDDDALYEIARTVEEQNNLVSRFDKLDVEELLGSECFPCINECILRKYMTEISENVIKIDRIIATVEKRRTQKWYKRVRYYYDGLLQVANMQKFYQDNVTGFHIAEYDKLWKEYCTNYCQMDYYYRMFHFAFGRCLKESTTVLEDLYKNVADYVEKLYKNWFLKELGGQWMQLVSDEFSKSAMLPEIMQQKDFYKTIVEPVSSNGRAYVIISDALRYEVAAQLAKELTRDSKGSATIQSMQSVFPSATKFGMAALLPGNKLQLTDDMKVTCNGMPTDGTFNRDLILSAAHSGNVALTYKSFIAMKQAERREKVAEANVVYIYHNAIDVVGDKQNTEDQVFDACDQAITEIKNLVRLIVNDLSGTNIIITADHGFLYSFKPLDESDKAEKDFISGDIKEFDRRYVIADSNSAADHMIKIPLTHLNSSLNGYTPYENIRMKKSGGGMNYVHGGISLQEIVVPVVIYKNVKVGSKNYVDKTVAKIQLLSQSRKVSNSIFSLDFYQTEAVSGKVSKADYSVYMADASGVAVSDKQKIIADNSSANGADRVTRVRFTLKSADFKKTDLYYLTIADSNGVPVEKIEFNIDIAFVNDFEF